MTSLRYFWSIILYNSASWEGVLPAQRLLYQSVSWFATKCCGSFPRAMPCFGCTSAGADLALQMGFCRAQMGRSRLWQQQAGEGLWRGGLCSIWAVCSSWSTAMGNGSAGHPVLKPGTVITPCQAPEEPFPSLSRAMREEGSLGNRLCLSRGERAVGICSGALGLAEKEIPESHRAGRNLWRCFSAIPLQREQGCSLQSWFCVLWFCVSLASGQLQPAFRI